MAEDNTVSLPIEPSVSGVGPLSYSQAEEIALAAKNGNSPSNSEIARDFQDLPWIMLARKYGEAAANSRLQISEARRNIDASLSKNRTAAEILADTAIGLGQSALSGVGSLASAYLGLNGKLLNNDGLSAQGASAAQAATRLSESLNKYKSDSLQESNRLSQLKDKLDLADSNVQYERDKQNNGEFLADIQYLGRNTLNAAENILDDPRVAGDVVVQGLGSLVPSSLTAKALSKLATATLSKFTKNQASLESASYAGATVGIGISEASGVYQQTVSAVMDLKHEQLVANSPEYASLIASGIDPKKSTIDYCIKYRC